MINRYPRVTRAHFQMIAAVMSEGRTWAGTVSRFADELAKSNPAFNRRKFIEACCKPHLDENDTWE